MSDDNATTRNVLVRSMRHETDGVISLELEALEGPLPPWQPGAHVDIVVGDGTTRQYSLCGPADARTYRIGVLREPDGRGGSAHVHTSVRPGDRVELKGPRNHFALESAPVYRLVAGGIGVTPILAMAAHLEAQGSDWKLFYAGRSRSTMAFIAELEAYGDKVVFSADDEGARLDLGAIVADAPADALWYACGPSGLLAALDETLVAAGRGDNLRTELFAVPVSDEPAAATDGFSVELRASGMTLQVPSDRSILEVVTEAGIDVMHDCEEGICGSCETKVLDGEIDHRDYVLTNQEKAKGDCMMVCVSRANCPVLVLDL
ncbi:PDR/VanB family oxidoreductase [Salinibacterium hongtaonis]|uniref:PDR/VanB family oxidoreductase n=1 Tax=Homoserinimonas hongtaonis TaxID=2079791 RepID=UPI000D3CD9A1|nr:PDR/VanB family oxidoreductase [Salinibacterium hongtaonis]AWB88614.1 oxidoreductase [Salinibacterium hongtaonis]